MVLMWAFSDSTLPVAPVMFDVPASMKSTASKDVADLEAIL